MRAPDQRLQQGIRRLLFLGWLTVGVAVAVSAVAEARSGWAPVVDNALIAAMTVDTFTSDPPLVGMPTSLGLEDGAPLSHPGPLGFWLLAVPTKLLGEPGHGLILGSALVSLASLAGVAALLRRQRDTYLEALALVLTAAMIASIGARTFSSPFNPHLGLLPLLLCAVAVWGVLAGRHRQVWVVVIAGSVAAQTHLGYVPLVAALVALTTAALGVAVARSSGALRRRLMRRVLPVAVASGVVAWIGPIIDQLFGSGNLGRLLTSQSGDRSSAGLGHGLDVAVEMTALPPRWLLGRATDQDLSDPGAIRIATSLAMVAALAGLLVWAYRRRSRALAALTVVSLVSLVAATLSTARVVDLDTAQFFDAQNALLYRLFWWPVGLLFALALLWGSTRIASSLSQETVARRWVGPARLATTAALLVGVVLLSRTSYQEPIEGLRNYYSHQFAHAEAIADIAGPAGTVVLRFEPEGGSGPETSGDEPPLGVWDVGPDQRYAHAANLLAQLRLRDISVQFADEPDGGITFMRAYRSEHVAEDGAPAVVLFRAGESVHEEPPPGYRRLSFSPAEPGDPFVNTPTAVYVRTSDEPAVSPEAMSPR